MWWARPDRSGRRVKRASRRYRRWPRRRGRRRLFAFGVSLRPTAAGSVLAGGDDPAATLTDYRLVGHEPPHVLPTGPDRSPICQHPSVDAGDGDARRAADRDGGFLSPSRMEESAGSDPAMGGDGGTPIAPANRQIYPGRSRHYARRITVWLLLAERRDPCSKGGASGRDGVCSHGVIPAVTRDAGWNHAPARRKSRRAGGVADALRRTSTAAPSSCTT